MIKEEWQHNPELYIKALLLRLHDREANISAEELANAENYVLTALYVGEKVVCRACTAMAWPEEPNGDMLNGDDEPHCPALAKLLSERAPWDDIEVNGS